MNIELLVVCFPPVLVSIHLFHTFRIPKVHTGEIIVSATGWINTYGRLGVTGVGGDIQGWYAYITNHMPA